MKKLTRVLLAAAAVMAFCACSEEKPEPFALFTEFSYSGYDSAFDVDVNYSGQYQNPILSGFYPDPSICRKGEDFFLVNSTFAYYPGVPIFHSRDLVNWTQLGHVLNRPGQLQLSGIRKDGGIYAPAISYNPYNEMFYMVATNVDGIGNFYVKTDDPFSCNWSDPILLPQVNGIDPSFFFDTDGKAYLVHNGECPGEPQWDGHRAIWMYEFDYDSDCLTGDKVLLVDGGTDPAEHPVWIEGPHMYNVDGKYVLICAEGGTGTWHSEVAFTSDSPYGPFVPHVANPILTQRDLPENRENKVTSTGHADIVQTVDGSWWAVFLGCRPYEGDMYNTGRETFLLPVKWVDGIPVVLPRGESVPALVEKSGLFVGSGKMPHGNYSWMDNFDKLDHKWVQLRTPESQWWETSGGLKIWPKPVTINDPGMNPAFMAVRQCHMNFESHVVMDYDPEDESRFAGLAVFQSENSNFHIGKTLYDGEPVVALYKTSSEGHSLVARTKLTGDDADADIAFRVIAEGPDYEFFYSTDASGQWTMLGGTQDGRILSTHRSGGFTGVVVGCYATSSFNVEE